MGKPRIKPRSARSIAEKGEVICRSCLPEHSEVALTMNTSTAYLSLKECYRILRSLDMAATKTWGEEWTNLFKGSE